MTVLFTDESSFEIAKPYRLQWEQAQRSYVLLYPEGMIQLNQTAGLILDRCCQGQKTIGQTIVELAQEFGEPDHQEIGQDVYEFLKAAYGNQWIKERQ
ncbi:MAG: pyrroloquinoline quinone biosynthesis peptide chaperone PqqD [Oligoflexus sp.]